MNCLPLSIPTLKISPISQQHLFTAITILEQAVIEDIPHTELEPEEIAQAALYLAKLYKNIGDTALYSW